MMAAMVINALVVVLEGWGLATSISINGMPGNFVFYTQCSNLLGAVACLLCLLTEIRSRGAVGLSRPLRWLKYAASCCLLMTFVVVVTVLAPMLEAAGQPGFYMMFAEDAKPVTHLVAPVLVFGSYVVFEADRNMSLRQSLVGLVPTLIYTVVAYPCNILRLWDGPYPFLQVWRMPLWVTLLWFVVLLVLSFSLCQVPRIAAKRIHKASQ